MPAELPELVKAAREYQSLLGLIVAAITALISLNTRLALQRLRNDLMLEQEARCQFCQAVKFEPRRQAADAAAIMGLAQTQRARKANA